MYTDKEIISWARDYVYDDQTLDRLERRTGIPHSTIWWNFHHTLRDLDYDLYDLTMKRIRVNKHSFGRGGVLELGGKVVITSKQDVELPKSLVYQSRVIKKNLIIWRFKTEEDAIRAARLFMSAGFEVVRRPI